jgi:HlyD family secretion protein
MRATIVFLVLLGLGGAGVFYYTKHLSAESPTTYRTANVKRGDLVSTISATGTVEPEEVIDIGAQVAGIVNSLGKDPKNPEKSIDWCSVVDSGTVLARIEDSIYKAQVDQDKATLQVNEANLLSAQAKLHQTVNDWKRAKDLLPTKSIADTDYDAAEANYETAKANVALAVATIAQSKAALQKDETNLGYTVITSPVKGVIIDRRVNIGQTVVASLSAPSLFLLAKDLRRLQVWASVNEADIGRIHEGLPVEFTVDAYPNEIFHGTVAQIRLNATMTQNVVTYTVVVDTDNSNLLLLPYLTANLLFQIDRHRDVLLVPNAALRWLPRPPQIVPELREATLKLMAGKGKSHAGQGKTEGEAKATGDAKAEGEAKAPADTKAEGEPKVEGEPRPAGPLPGDKPKLTKPGDSRLAGSKPVNPPHEKHSHHGEHGRLWAKDGDFVRPVEVLVGPSDGSFTEVSGKDLTEGMEVVFGEARTEQVSDTTNPFAPSLFKGKAK